MGTIPVCNDSLVNMLLLLTKFLPYQGENQFRRFIRADYLASFLSNLIRASSNTGLGIMLADRRPGAALGGPFRGKPTTQFWLVTKTIFAFGYKWNKNCSARSTSVAIDMCDIRLLKYFSYKQVKLTTSEGIAVNNDSVSANTSERTTARTKLLVLWYFDVGGKN